ncbi:MAG: electron transfer flavoprotein subunit beta/FixA family protein [Oscillospiraceae bacterium]|nr:electron transfer flavoprotein subunit beta/FixA family protein [Oscillospiraceae bacterium]
MDILVCIKQVPGTSRVEIDPETGTLKRDGVRAKLNPYDLNAIEMALALRDRVGGTVRCVTMGPPQAAQAVMDAVYMGVDSGVVISDRAFAGADVYATSYTLAQGIGRLGAFDVIFCGKQTTDGDTGQVGPEVAELLDIPHVANVTRIDEIAAGYCDVCANQDDSEARLRVKMPCLLGVDSDANTPRQPDAGRKENLAQDDVVSKIALNDLADTDESHYGLGASPTQVERIFAPEKNTAREMFEGNAEQMAEALYRVLAENGFVSGEETRKTDQ